MAARRRKSASSLSRSSTPRTRSGSREPAEKALKADRDGRYQVVCPKCSAAYRVPEDFLDERMTCKSCKSVFTPRTVLSKVRRPRKKDYSGLVAAGVGAVLLVVALIVINSVQGVEKKKPATQPFVASLDMLHPAWMAWERFCDAMQSKDQIALLSALDIEAYYKHKAGKKTKPYDRLEESEIKAWKDQEAESLFTDPQWLMLREFKPSGLNTYPDTPKDVQKLEFESMMAPGDDRWKGYGIIEVVTAITKAGLWKVRSFKIVKEPRQKAVAKPKGKFGYHKKLGKGKMTTVTDSTGKAVTVRTIDPQPLEHLEDTPKPLRKEIDQLLEALKDPNLPARRLIDTRRRLEQIGAPAIPRILTQFYETRTEGVSGSTLQDNLNFINLLTRILRTVTMHSGFGFAPAREEGGALGISDKMRQIALKGWFGWYSSFGWKRDNAYYDKKRKEAEEEDIGIEEWGEHKKRKRSKKRKK